MLLLHAGENISALRKTENRKIKKLRREWLDAPLISSLSNFPAQIYQSASDAHKHYDTLSHIVVAGSLAIFGYVLFATQRPLFYLSTAFILILLWALYERMARIAREARRMMEIIEVSFDQPGFSVGHARLVAHYPVYLANIRTTVSLIYIFMIAALVLTSILTLAGIHVR